MLIKKIKAVEKILVDAEKQTTLFARKSGISCHHNCGSCCTTTNIGASSLEFLPAAYQLFKEKKLYQFLDQSSQEDAQTICMFFNPFSEESGNCLIYPNRGLICRLFGYSKWHDKNGEAKLITCAAIKQSANYLKLDTALLKHAPFSSDYYTRLSGIDIYKANIIIPVNQAIRAAMEEVAFYFSYNRKKPA